MIKYKQLNSNVVSKNITHAIPQKYVTPFTKKQSSTQNFSSLSKPNFVRSSSSHSQSSSVKTLNKSDIRKSNQSYNKSTLKSKNSKIRHSKTTSSDLLDHYNKILDISKQMTVKKNCTIESFQQTNFPEAKDDDLFCDEVLEITKKKYQFQNSVFKTPIYYPQPLYAKYHQIKELPVVEERIISEEEKQYISERKLNKDFEKVAEQEKNSNGFPLNTTIKNSNLVAYTAHTHEKQSEINHGHNENHHGNILTSFEIIKNEKPHPQRIKIDVHQLIKKRKPKNEIKNKHI